MFQCPTPKRFADDCLKRIAEHLVFMTVAVLHRCSRSLPDPPPKRACDARPSGTASPSPTFLLASVEPHQSVDRMNDHNDNEEPVERLGSRGVMASKARSAMTGFVFVSKEAFLAFL